MKKEPIRIAQVIGKWVGGGVEAVVMNYYRHINHNKIKFDFICDEDSTNIPYEEIESLGGRVILIPPYQKPIQYHFKLKKVLKEGKYTIVHSHINTMSLFPLFAAFCAGVKVRIAHSHSTTSKNEWLKNMMKQILRLFSKLFATNYMSCTEHAGRWMFGNKTFEKGRVFVLNNAIELEKFAFDEKIRKKKRKELKIKNDSLVIGHVGRFVAQKNHTFIIDIFNEIHKKNPKSLLLLVGQGPLVEDTKKKVEMLGLNNSVEFLGQRNDVAEIYQAMDVFLLPSLYEGLGMVLVEAQCAGCIGIASTEVPEIAKITENVDFLDLKIDPEIWAMQTLEATNNYKRKDCIAEASKSGYNIENESYKLEQYYLEQKR